MTCFNILLVFHNDLLELQYIENCFLNNLHNNMTHIVSSIEILPINIESPYKLKLDFRSFLTPPINKIKRFLHNNDIQHFSLYFIMFLVQCHGFINVENNEIFEQSLMFYNNIEEVPLLSNEDDDVDEIVDNLENLNI